MMVVERRVFSKEEYINMLPDTKGLALDIVLPEDSAIPLLSIYPEDSPTYNKGTCSTLYVAALFIIARSWKEPRLSLNRGMDGILRQMNGTEKYSESGNPIIKNTHGMYSLISQY